MMNKMCEHRQAILDGMPAWCPYRLKAVDSCSRDVFHSRPDRWLRCLAKNKYFVKSSGSQLIVGRVRWSKTPDDSLALQIHLMGAISCFQLYAKQMCVCVCVSKISFASPVPSLEKLLIQLQHHFHHSSHGMTWGKMENWWHDDGLKNANIWGMTNFTVNLATYSFLEQTEI